MGSTSSGILRIPTESQASPGLTDRSLATGAGSPFRLCGLAECWLLPPGQGRRHCRIEAVRRLPAGGVEGQRHGARARPFKRTLRARPDSTARGETSTEPSAASGM